MIKTSFNIHKTAYSEPQEFNQAVDRVLEAMRGKNTIEISGFDVTPIRATLEGDELEGLTLNIEGYIK